MTSGFLSIVAMSDQHEPADAATEPSSEASDSFTNEDETSTPETPASEVVGLRRSTVNRKIGGVAGGIGERFDIDANIVRVGFVVLCFLWGLGAAIYLVMWALVPLSGASTPTTRETPEPPTRRFSLRTVVLGLAALFVALMLVAVARRGFVFARGLSVVWLAFLVVLAFLSFRRPGRRLSLMRLVAGAFIAVLSLVIIAMGAVLGYLALAGVPFSGGVGQSIYQPTSFAQVHHVYRMAAGRMIIDLRSVSFENHTIAVTSTVGIGTLTVEVPNGVSVNLTAEGGPNGINYPFEGQRQFYAGSGTGTHAGHLELNLKVGIGTISLIRAAPGQWVPLQ
jgi:phage shock protein PspC (stress-responsive transcriptional regulator)